MAGGIPLIFDGDATFQTTWDETVLVTEADHTRLINRDAAQQHPITSITDLAPELSARPSTALSNQDILDILTT